MLWVAVIRCFSTYAKIGKPYRAIAQEENMAEIWTMGEMLVEIMRPHAGVPLNQAGAFLGPFPSGAPAIFIDAAARLGHPVGIIGGVAQDDFGRCLLERLSQHGVDVQFVQRVPERATAVAFVTYFEDGSRKFIYHIDGTPAVMAQFLPAAAQGAPQFFHVMGCSLMTNDAFRAEIFKATECFHKQRARISFDPNIRPELLRGRDLMEVIGPVLERAAVVLPGEAELRMLAGVEDLQAAVGQLFANPVLEMVVLKQGKRGATVFTRAEAIPIPAYSVREVDPTGAGDYFDAGFLCGILEGRSPEACGKMAAAAGALNAAAFGPMEGEISPERLWEVINR
jgi:sugar/nucleoside kinase (ribokinase family)